jgi:anti-sigma factor RsiW
MNTNGSHWTDEELLQRVYGLDTAPESHLKECSECSARWDELQRKRQEMMAPAASSDALEGRLRVQRQAIWNRIEQPQRSMWWRAMPVAATALMLVIGVSLQQPAPSPAKVQVSSVKDMSDEQLFSEIASVANQESPRASDPIRGLFAENSGVEAQ